MTNKPTPAAKRFTPASAVPFVKRFQQALLDNGADLPKHGADGLFGPETERAFAETLRRAVRVADAQKAENAQMRAQIAALERGRDYLIDEVEDARDFIEESWSFTGFDVVLLSAGSAALGAAGMWVAITVGAM